jgi:Sulfotransferase domain
MLIQQRDAAWWFKLNGALRYAIAQGAANAFGAPVVVTEYPKSGGTWFSQMFAAALDLPYPRNRLPHLRRQIIHGCYLKSSPGADTMVVWRDGRDIMVSYYYHLIFEKPITSARYSRSIIAKLDIKDQRDIQRYLPRFIEWCYAGGYPYYSWTHFVKTWLARQDVHQTSYEKVTENPLRELQAAFAAFGWPCPPEEKLKTIIADFSFEAQSDRPRGVEDVTSFVRKGIIGDWQNHFTGEACEVFDRLGGAELITLGYEKDRGWIEQQKRALVSHKS